MWRPIMTLSGGMLALILAAAAGNAQPFSPKDLPPELRPWVPWVLDEVPDLGCPTVRGQAVCLWPGRLQLDLGGAGGSFGLELQADRLTDVPLPGTAELWPQDTRLDGAPAPAFGRDGAPRLRVGAGRHRVSGRFVWSRLPESLSVPTAIGIVDLRLDGQAVARPRREAGGLLWLRARSATSEDGDSLRLQVFRNLKDGVPIFVETRIQLEVAGRAREVTLAGALLAGSVPVGIEGDLPARIEGAALRVQVRGGRYVVVVRARIEGRPKTIARPKAAPAGDWPEREVWVFSADERLRQIELAGAPPIDPSRTELPGEWRSLPAFVVEPGAALVLSEVRRGQPAPPPDALSLRRDLWLDPSGRGASVRDHFGGTLRGTTRLDLLPPAALGRVSVDGQDQLVTSNPETRASGIELRRETLSLDADSRLPLGGPLHAVGWSTSVEELSQTLHLPPGWSLLAASGVDQLPGTWSSRWTLLGFFFVLIVALAVYRLFGIRQALVALVTLVLLHGEPGAPLLVWLSLVAAIALRRVAPAGRLSALARLWFLASAAALVVIVVPFARDQVRDALFPQVSQAELQEVTRSVTDNSVVGPAAPPPAPVQYSVDGRRPAVGGAVQAPEAAEPEEADVRVEDKLDYAHAYGLNQALERDPKAVLQTGPGMPTWTWRSYSLAWTGPVGRDHTMRLFLASPGLNRLFTALRLGLLALFGTLLVIGRWPRLPRRSRAASLPLAAAFLVALAAPVRAEEEPARESKLSKVPDGALLQELKRRLTRSAPCEPSCVSTPSLELRLANNELQLSAEVHAAADGTWAVPGPLATWAPSQLRVDGAPAVAGAQLPDGFLYVRLSRGVHRIEGGGPLPPGDSFTLQFADPPRRARAFAPGWDVSGLRADGPAEPSILLSRRLGPRASTAGGEGRYAPWLEITRTLGFGVTWTVETRVRRLTPVGTPVALRVPLLTGEAPTRANLVVEHGEAAVSLGGDEVETAWGSTLTQVETLRLRAPEDRPWSEVWRLQCSAIWPCAASGLPPVSRIADGIFTPEFRPWPGETLGVSLRHPDGVPGQTLTIDNVTIDASPGSRLERVRATLAARSSREQPLLLRLPRDAEVQTVTLDAQERPSRPEAGELRVTVPAGAHAIEVRWQQPRGIGVSYEIPRLGLSAPAVNVSQQLTLPPSRWLLLTHGPAWGPAVLFWPYLVFLLAAAFLLGRLPPSPLTSVRWILLGLGLSQLPALGALTVAAFLFALSLRARRPPRGAARFDLVQILLALWAVASLALLYIAIHRGLLFRPDMQVAGNGSADTALRWYADRVSGATPPAGIVSLPLWMYRVAMLVWSLWLAAGLARGVGWGWRAFGEDGFWRPLRLVRQPGRKPSAPASPAGNEGSPGGVAS